VTDKILLTGERFFFMFTKDDLRKLLAEGMPLRGIIREAAKDVIHQALQVEAEDFISQNQEELLDGKPRLVFNGTLPEREILFSCGPVSVKAPRVRDNKDTDEKFQFKSNLLPRYLRTADEVATLIPWMYLKGISENDFQPMFEAIFGEEIKGLSGSTVGNLIHAWDDEYLQWSKRDLSGENYPYIFADGVNFKVKERDNCSQLVLLGVDETGRKRLVGFEEGYAESKESWRGLFIRLKEYGLKAPKLVVGDGGLGLWSGLGEVFPDCQRQFCWVHKVKDAKKYLPQSLHKQVLFNLKNIYLSETKEEAIRQVKIYKTIYEEKYPKAVETITKNIDNLLTFYSFPAVHWVQLRTNNPIESMFSTLRLRTNKMRGQMGRGRLGAMIFKLCQMASKKMKAIVGADRLRLVLEGKKFENGILAGLATPEKDG
jgi:transposase-like protein